MLSKPKYLGQAKYLYALYDQNLGKKVLPSLAESFKCDRPSSVWLIIEQRSVIGLRGELVWFEHAVGRYHRSSVSRRKVKRWTQQLNRRPIGEYFYRDAQSYQGVAIYRKRRDIKHAPMKTRRLGAIVEDEIVEHKLLSTSVSEIDLIAAEQDLEQKIDEQNRVDQEKYQKDYYLSLRGKVSGDDGRILASKLIELGSSDLVDELPKIQIQNKFGRVCRSLKGIGGRQMITDA